MAAGSECGREAIVFLCLFLNAVLQVYKAIDVPQFFPLRPRCTTLLSEG